MINERELENKIIMCSKSKDYPTLTSIRSNLIREKNKLQYFMTRFMDTFGEKVDNATNDEFNCFYRAKSNEYSSINRLIRVLDAYER